MNEEFEKIKERFRMTTENFVNIDETGSVNLDKKVLKDMKILINMVDSLDKRSKLNEDDKLIELSRNSYMKKI